jgi:hypothetical protein
VKEQRKGSQLTALGNPVVPLLKLKYPQRSAFPFPSGIFQLPTWPLSPFSNLSPSSTISCTVLKPFSLPSNKITLSRPNPTISAALTATPKFPSIVIKNRAFAVRSAYASTPYAGLTPLITAPARRPPNMATGYQMLFCEKREMVSPGHRPWARTSAVQRCVLRVRTAAKLRRAPVAALV